VTALIEEERKARTMTSLIKGHLHGPFSRNSVDYDNRNFVYHFFKLRSEYRVFSAVAQREN